MIIISTIFYLTHMVLPFLGVAIFAKALIAKRFCFTSYIVAQVLFHIEFLYRLGLHEFAQPPSIVNNFTYMIIYCASTIIITKLFLKILKKENNWSAIIWGSVMGTYGVFTLTSIASENVRPFYPFLNSNPLYDIIDRHMLGVAIICSGILGLGILVLRKWQEK